MTGIFALLQLIVSPISGAIKRSQEKKAAAAASTQRIAEAKTTSMVKRLETSQDADIAWERTSLENAGWKDEFLLIVFSIPVIMCFIPGMDVYVSKGFDALDKTPQWFQWSYMVMVASSYGYKKLADLMALKKGS